MIRALLMNMLEALGYTASHASSLPEAMQLLEQDAERASCVLLDLNMPEHDGNDAFVRIREKYPLLRILFMSGYEARAAPLADGFLHKPFTMDDLRQVLRTVAETSADESRAI